jgi:hypothetical protein
MQEVGGSIPPGSTSLRWLRQLRLGRPGTLSRSEVSEGCRAEARKGEGGLVVALRYTSTFSPSAAFNLSRSATISLFNAVSSGTEHSDAARIDIGRLRARSFSASP